MKPLPSRWIRTASRIRIAPFVVGLALSLTPGLPTRADPPSLPSPAVTPGGQPSFSVTAFGAAPDGAASCSEAFQRAIAACKAAGGGTVEVPAGRYRMTGPIDLVDHMNLHLEAGAVVVFDSDRADYPPISSRWEGLTEVGPHPLLFADGLHDVSITGSGTFDGQGAAWWASMDPAERGDARPDRPIRRRPPLVQIRNCDGVRIEGPTFTNAPFWTIHLLYSEHVDVGNCRLINPENSPNTDGLNSDSCRHVVVHDCYADVGDDGFGIKSGRDEEGRRMNRPTEDITYTRLHVRHAHGICVIGSETSAGVRHVRFLDCDGDGTYCGIRIKSTRGRGGLVEDVVADNIRLRNVGTGIVLSLHYTVTPPEPYSPERTPRMQGIVLRNVTGTGLAQCVRIEGLEEQAIENVAFENVRLSGLTGIDCSHARNITFDNTRVSAENGPAFVESACDNVRRTGPGSEP